MTRLTPSDRPRHRRAAAAGVVVAGLALAGCSAGGSPAPSPSPTVSQSLGRGSASPSASALPSLADTTVSVPSGLGASPFDTTRTVQAPAGWSVSVWARMDAPRLEAWAPDGRLLVSRPAHGDVLALRPASGGGAPTQTTVVDGLTQPHGLAFDGSTLYVAESDEVDAYRYADGAVSDRRVVVDGLPDAKSADLGGAYAHALKSVVVGPDRSLYVSIGSTANISPADRSAVPERASILRVDPETGRYSVYAQGVRNGTGLAVAPDGAVWTAVNDRDQTPYPYDRDYDGDGKSDLGRVMTAYVNDHPEEMVARLTEGRDLGWPYCDPDPDVDPGARGTALDFTDRGFVRDQDTNADGSKLDCASLPDVELGLPAHSAPLGMAFTPSNGLAGFGRGALIGVHGSWDRTPPQPPQVWFLPWRDGTLQPPVAFLTGFQDPGGSRWGRTVAAVQGPDGAVYVTDDTADAIYRVAPAG